MLLLNQIVLEREGFKVFTASSGSNALEKLTQISNLDLVLLDFNLEDMKGSEFVDIVDSQNLEVLKNVPIVYYTGMNEVINSKAAGYIKKEGNINKFIKSVHSFI